MTHHEVLNSPNKLIFRHAVPVPQKAPDITSNSMKLWYIENGFICISPMRAFNQEKCRFMFPFSVAGSIAYECTFEEIQPLSYRIPRNSGTVQIATNKNPVTYHRAIAIIWKELSKALKYYSRLIPRTHLYKNYLNNCVFRAAGCIVPAYVYNGNVYVLYVDYRQVRAEYKLLISESDIMKLYIFVGLQTGDEIWANSFGFTQKDFMALIEKSTHKQ